MANFYRTICCILTPTFYFSLLPGQAQTLKDGLSNQSSYFMTLEKKAAGNSRKVYLNDKVTIRLVDRVKKTYRLTDMSPNQLELDAKLRIDLDKIIRIKKTTPRLASIGVGIVFALAGGRVLLPVFQGRVNFDTILPQTGLGLGLIALSVPIIIPAWYKIDKGDKILISPTHKK